MSSRNEREVSPPQVSLHPGHYLITLYSKVVPEEGEPGGWCIEEEMPLGVFEFVGHTHSEYALKGFACRCTDGVISPADIGNVEVEEGGEIYCLCSVIDGSPLLEVSLH